MMTATRLCSTEVQYNTCNTCNTAVSVLLEINNAATCTVQVVRHCTPSVQVLSALTILGYPLSAGCPVAQIAADNSDKAVQAGSKAVCCTIKGLKDQCRGIFLHVQRHPALLPHASAALQSLHGHLERLVANAEVFSLPQCQWPMARMTWDSPSRGCVHS